MPNDFLQIGRLLSSTSRFASLVIDLSYRREHIFKKFNLLPKEIAHSLRAKDVILDGEIACLDADGRSNFQKLLFRRDWPYYLAFDLLTVDGENLGALSLLERKRRLRSLMPKMESQLLYVDHVAQRGSVLFRAACKRDLEGVVGKWRDDRKH